MIRPAKEMDVATILDITKACGAHLRAKNIFQWNSDYPDLNTLLRDVKRKELWVFEDKSVIKGCVVLSDFMDKEYENIPWTTLNEGAKYVHRLAVHPNWQRQGIAGSLMDFAEQLASNTGSTAVRLDTFSRNSGNQLFYEKRGYRACGSIYFPKQSAYPFYCYELILSKL